MKYAAIRSFDVTNGEGNGVSLFVQGCPFHCKGCFNPETWNFSGGKEWNEETIENFLRLVGRDYIKRVSFLGGSPLCDENVTDVRDTIYCIKERYPDKQIWVYTGMIWEDIYNSESNYKTDILRREILTMIDVLVDGPFDYSKRDITLPFKGSSNQRIIDVQASLANDGVVVLYNLEQ